MQPLLKKLMKWPCFGLVLFFSLTFFLITTVWPLSKDSSQAHVSVVTREEEIPATSDKLDDYEYSKALEYSFSNPTDRFTESIPFRYFDSHLTYQTEGSAERTLSEHEQLQLTPVKQLAAEYLRNQEKEDISFTGGRYRWLPEGIEYDLSFKDTARQVTNRVALFQKLDSSKVIRSMEIKDDTVVHIIITLQGRLEKYAIFLDHLVKVVLPKENKLTLTVVYFRDRSMEAAEELTKTKLLSFPKIEWSFIPLEDENFSRGRGLQVGAESKKGKGSEILFFCDVDILMLPDFFDRCRSNTVQGQQVYYPVVFSLYNPKLVYPLFDKEIPSIANQLSVNEQSGFWRAFGFGMTCMYASDYDNSGGFPDVRTWGAEDEALHEKLLQIEEIKVLRSPDPGLFHLYHRKECPDTTSISYPACLKSKALTEGSQLQLGLTLLKFHEGTDLEGILSKRFYYFWLVPYLAVFLFLSLVTNILQATAAISSRKIQVYNDVTMKRQL